MIVLFELYNYEGSYVNVPIVDELLRNKGVCLSYPFKELNYKSKQMKEFGVDSGFDSGYKILYRYLEHLYVAGVIDQKDHTNYYISDDYRNVIQRLGW